VINLSQMDDPSTNLPDEQNEPPDEQNEPEFVKEQRSKRHWRTLAISVTIVAVIALANSLIKLPYYILGPGDALPVKNYITVPPDKSNGQSGKLLLATVALTSASPIDFVLAKITPGDEIDGKSAILGTSTTQTQYLQENETAMTDSQQTAIAVAMTRAGFQVKQLGDGAQVIQVAPNTPASGKLNPDDTITSINGQTVITADDAVGIVHPLPVGAVAHLTVKDEKGDVRPVDVTLAAKPGGGSYMGVLLETLNPHLQTPFPVTFKSTDIGGPSAGLAFTLTLLDELTPGELTGGQTIAATGTINPDGSVGEVGGVKQKTIAVQNAGAKIFLVPSAEYNDAKKEAHAGLTVIPVDTLDQAVAALAAHGGNASGIPPAPQSTQA
jgi:Lon-like protease